MILIIKRILAYLSIVGLLGPSLVFAAEDLVASSPQPNQPTSLVQTFDTVNPLAVGGINPTSTIQINGQVSEPLASGQTDTLLLELELRTVDTAFGFTPTHQSEGVIVTGSVPVQAMVMISNLGENKYHWQLRVRNQTNLVSNWVAFGANSDAVAPAATDFEVNFPPAPPSAVKAVTCEINCPTVHAVNLGWTNAVDSDLLAVEIWRSTSLDSVGFKIATVNKPGQTLLDGGLAEGTIYYYRLRSVDAVGNFSNFTDVTTAVTNIIIDEADGSRVTRTNGWSTAGLTGILVAGRGSTDNITYRPNLACTCEYEIFVNWLVSPSVPVFYGSQATETRYTVMIDGSASAILVDQTKLADQLTTPTGKDLPSGFFKLGSFSLPAGTKTTVRLDGSSTGFVVADQSKFVFLRPVPPTNLNASDRPNDNGGAIELNFTASSSANVVAYNIYRSISTGSYDLTKPLATTTGTSFVDETATTGITFFYIVRASDRSRESVSSNETSTVAKDNLAPAAPTITGVDIGDGFVVLKWTRVTDAVGYLIRYRDPATEAGFHSMLIADQNATSTKITDLSNDVEHEFGIAARDAAGNESGFATTKATPKGPSVAAVAAKVVTAGLVGKAKAAEPETQKEVAGPSAQEGKIKAAETARQRSQRIAVTVAILVIAVAAGVAGYYGYDWWLRRQTTKPKPRGRNGRW